MSKLKRIYYFIILMKKSKKKRKGSMYQMIMVLHGISEKLRVRIIIIVLWKVVVLTIGYNIYELIGGRHHRIGLVLFCRRWYNFDFKCNANVGTSS